MESERLELHRLLVEDISKGLEQVKQQKLSCSNKEQERGLQRRLSSYEEALSILTGRAPQEPCESVITSSPRSNPPPSSNSASKEKLSKPPTKDEEEGLDEEEEEEEDEHGDILCGACGENYAQDEFWICCDICERWFHGKCVKITPARAEHIKQYKCPSCSNKRARP